MLFTIRGGKKEENLAVINLITLSNPGQNITVSFLR